MEVPYQAIIPHLVRSTMFALAELARAQAAGMRAADVQRRDINRHFIWLNQHITRGKDPHLFDGDHRFIHPLRVDKKSRPYPPSVRKILSERGALPIDCDIYRSEPTRISELVRNAFLEASPDERVLRNFRSRGAASPELFEAEPQPVFGILLPSPLAIVLNFLAVPDMAATKAYPLIALRNFLLERFSLMPSAERIPKGFVSLTVSKLEEELRFIATYQRDSRVTQGADNVPSSARPSAALLRHFLAMKGLFFLRFGSAKSGSPDPLSARVKYCEGADPFASESVEFRMNPFATRLPDLGELVNEIWGIPLPIRGADTIFQGGLKFPASGGLVVAVHGGPGTGKTSLALTIGATLAPLGIRTLFITVEEAEQDLRARVPTLLPDRMRRLSLLANVNDDWLIVPNPSRRQKGIGTAPHIHSIIATLKHVAETLDEHNSASSETNELPLPCRLVIVLDGLHEFVAASDNNARSAHIADPTANIVTPSLHDLIQACREVKALVILTTGDQWAGHGALDFLVDVALRMRHAAVDDLTEKPHRTASLIKARHQLCRPGSYTMHLGGEKGFRFSPQISLQIDRRAVWKMRLPVRRLTKLALNRYTYASDLDSIRPHRGGRIGDFAVNTEASFLSIYGGSHVFIHGHGSGGKAALGLKLATSPLITSDPMTGARQIERMERVLVVSFLYPEEYYDEVLAILKRLQTREFSDELSKFAQRSAISRSLAREDEAAHLQPRMHVLSLYPGFLLPNDLFNKIEGMLDAAEMSGDPFTALLLDGIHNCFLQFPRIQDYGLFWPILYNSIRRRAITMITTSTTLVVPGSGSSEPMISVDDRRSVPLRHALVQKVDFQFEVDRVDIKDVQPGVWKAIGNEPNIFSVQVFSAIGQPIPAKRLLWSREKSVFFDSEEPTQPLKRLL